MFEKLIKSHRYRDYAPINGFTNRELREFCTILIEFCIDHVGVKKTKGVPTFSVRKDYSGNYFGQYHPEQHKIYMFYNNIDNIRDFVKTFIHEYTHSTQNLRHYENRLKRYGYDQHPDEIEALEMERKLYKSALTYLRNKI